MSNGIHKIFTGLGTALTGASQAFRNAELMRQREEQIGNEKEQLTLRRGLMRLDAANQQLERIGTMAVKNPSFAKKYAQLPSVRNMISKGFEFQSGGQTNFANADYDNFIDLYTTRGEESTNLKQIFDLSGKLLNDPSFITNLDKPENQALYEQLQQVYSSPDSAALMGNVMTNFGNIQKSAQMLEKLKAETELTKARTKTQSGSPFDDPRFAFKSVFDDSAFVIKNASEKISEYRKNLAELQGANPGSDINLLKKQALGDVGISDEGELNNLDRLSRMSPGQLAQQRLSSKPQERPSVDTGTQVPPPPPQEEPRQSVTGTAERTATRFSARGKRQMSESEIGKLAEAESLPKIFDDISKTLSTSKSLFGPARGRIEQANPFFERAQIVDGQLRTASQIFGRFMEGGVLRKEDEEKYRRMFPNLTDTPGVASGKLENVVRVFKLRLSLNKELLKAGGFQVPEATADDEKTTDVETIFDDLLPE